MFFIKQNGNFYQSREIPEIVTELEPNIYIIKFDEKMDKFFLEPYAEFSDIPKVYGNLDAMEEQIWKAYQARDKSTGIALQGFLGSGKTLLAKKLANRFVANKGIVIIINDAYNSVDFLHFIQNISQEHMLLFEEFEKVYLKEEHMNPLLTMFDGIFSKKRLIVVTTNSYLPRYFQQRPSRILYKYNFESISSDIIVEVCEDMGVSEITEQLLIFNRLFRYNFDSLFALIAEYKLSGNNLETIIDYLNINTDSSGGHYSVQYKVMYKDKDISDMFKPIGTSYYNLHHFDVDLVEKETNDCDEIAFGINDLVTIGSKKLEYKTEASLFDFPRKKLGLEDKGRRENTPIPITVEVTLTEDKPFSYYQSISKNLESAIEAGKLDA